MNNPSEKQITLTPTELGTEYGTKLTVQRGSFADEQLSQMHIYFQHKAEPTLLRYLTIAANQRENLHSLPVEKEEVYDRTMRKLKVEYDLIKEVRKCPSHFALLELILSTADKEKAIPENKFGLISAEIIPIQP